MSTSKARSTAIAALIAKSIRYTAMTARMIVKLSFWSIFRLEMEDFARKDLPQCYPSQ